MYVLHYVEAQMWAVVVEGVVQIVSMYSAGFDCTALLESSRISDIFISIFFLF